MTRILSAILLMALLGVWVVAVAVASDYHEVTVLLLGILWLLAAFVLSWDTRRRLAKAILFLLPLVIMLIVGVTAKKAGSYRTRVRTVIAQNMLAEVTRSLIAWRNQGGELPSCPWTCMAQTLQEAGVWPGLTIPYENRPESIHFESIPRNDEWGCRYRYEIRGSGHFVLTSSGPDRRLGTGDDLVVTDRSPLPVSPRSLPVFAASQAK